MSPVGGVGINYAIQDAVAAANLLADPLKRGQLQISHLQAVQQQRELPTWVLQTYQSMIQEGISSRFTPKSPIPVRFLLLFWLPLSLPLLGQQYARFIAYLIPFGLYRVRPNLPT